VNILSLKERKRRGEKLVMVTCYDYTAARILAQADVDLILVGDSAAMVMHGHATTLPITVGEMATHVRAVRRGAPQTFLVGDLPFLSFRRSLPETMDAVAQLMQASAEAVKLEGIAGNEDTIRHIVGSSVPVMGHLGMTPQSVHQLGGFRVQGVGDDARERLRADALACQRAGCFSLVLECVPETLAAEITAALEIPTIGNDLAAQVVGGVYDCSQFGVGQRLRHRARRQQAAGVVDIDEIRAALDLLAYRAAAVVSAAAHTLRSNDGFKLITVICRARTAHGGYWTAGRENGGAFDLSVLYGVTQGIDGQLVRPPAGAHIHDGGKAHRQGRLRIVQGSQGQIGGSQDDVTALIGFSQ
jgi:3-methyl-2-oxobutanoate hydroxymethyltransferase